MSYQYQPSAAGPISGPDFFWFLIREHREELEKYMLDYLHYEPDNSNATAWTNFCAIASARKYAITKNKNRMLRVHMYWSGRVNFKNAHAGGGCPLRGFTITGDPIPGYYWREDNYITFYLYQGKKYYPGDTSLCSQCVNQLKCTLAGKPVGNVHETYFSPIENVKKKRKKSVKELSNP